MSEGSSEPQNIEKGLRKLREEWRGETDNGEGFFSSDSAINSREPQKLKQN